MASEAANATSQQTQDHKELSNGAATDRSRAAAIAARRIQHAEQRSARRDQEPHGSLRLPESAQVKDELERVPEPVAEVDEEAGEYEMQINQETPPAEFVPCTLPPQVKQKLTALDDRLVVQLQAGAIRFLSATWLKEFRRIMPREHRHDSSFRMQMRQDLEKLEQLGQVSPLLSRDDAVSLIRRGTRAVGVLTYGYRQALNDATSLELAALTPGSNQPVRLAHSGPPRSVWRKA